MCAARDSRHAAKRAPWRDRSTGDYLVDSTSTVTEYGAKL